MSTRIPTSVPDTQLGLTTSEIQTLRYHQSIALPSSSSSSGPGHAAAAPGYTSSTTSSRGRGMSRSSGSSSRATSSTAGRSVGGGAGGGPGRLVLEAGSLAVLTRYFDGVMESIGARIDYLTAQTQSSALSQSRSAASTIAGADAEIARFRDLLRQLDELETEFDKVQHIRDIVAGFRKRVDAMGKRR
ncbi:hypothetical protein MMC25_005209 [Agyrium rufum]|nr:hypothetical protein [Agyrium rufum]